MGFRSVGLVLLLVSCGVIKNEIKYIEFEPEISITFSNNLDPKYFFGFDIITDTNDYIIGRDRFFVNGNNLSVSDDSIEIGATKNILVKYQLAGTYHSYYYYRSKPEGEFALVKYEVIETF